MSENKTRNSCFKFSGILLQVFASIIFFIVVDGGNVCFPCSSIWDGQESWRAASEREMCKHKYFTVQLEMSRWRWPTPWKHLLLIKIAQLNVKMGENVQHFSHSSAHNNNCFRTMCGSFDTYLAAGRHRPHSLLSKIIVLTPSDRCDRRMNTKHCFAVIHMRIIIMWSKLPTCDVIIAIICYCPDEALTQSSHSSLLFFRDSIIFHPSWTH